MSDDRNREWQQLLELSDNMLKHAHDGHWETITSMAVVRQAALEKFFTEPVSEEAAATIAAGIEAIQRIDSEISALAKDAHDATSQQQELLKKRQQATRAYTDSRFHQG